jgi:hypothetical protein
VATVSTLPANKKAKKVIHVNRQNIAFNAKWGEAILPTYIIRYKGRAIYAHGFLADGRWEAADPRKKKKLSCGARAWLETYGTLFVEDPLEYKDVLSLKEEYLEQVSRSQE